MIANQFFNEAMNRIEKVNPVLEGRTAQFHIAVLKRLRENNF